MQKYIVGISDMKSSKEAGVIVTFGLGSCIGIVLHDKTNKVTGMVHIMLPDSKKIKNNVNHAKFADTGIVKLLADMIVLGANRNNVTAKIAGGANMFQGSSKSNINVGEMNYAAVKNILKTLKIPVVAEDCGKDYGRTLEADILTGDCVIKTISKGSIIL